MEAVNSFLSLDTGYLNALRHAQPLPKINAVPEIILKPADGPKNNIATCILIGVGLLALGLIVYDIWRINKD